MYIRPVSGCQEDHVRKTDERSTATHERTASMTTFERKYTVDEKEAAIHAAIDRRIKPQKTVVLMAARGELVTKDGRQARPFDLNPSPPRSWVNTARRKRNGRIPGAAYENPEGTIEALRKRLIALADGELAHLE